MWDFIVATLSIFAFVMSALVLWKQEFGNAKIRCTVGPKVWIYQEESVRKDRMLVRIILPATFTNESPRGGTIEKIVLSWRRVNQPNRALIGWFYEAQIDEVDLNNPQAVAKRKIAGNPFHVPAKDSVTKYLLFDLNSIGASSDEKNVTLGPNLGFGKWEINVLAWSSKDRLFSISSCDHITIDDSGQAILDVQRRSKDMVSSIFLLDSTVKPMDSTNESLVSHYKYGSFENASNKNQQRTN